MHGEGAGRNQSAMPADKEVWRRCSSIEMEMDEAEHFLDLAGYAEGRLDPDEHERVSEFLRRDPEAAADVAAARAAVQAAEPPEMHEAAVARALALVTGGTGGVVVRFPARRSPPRLPGVARWASLAAAVLVASWLGFTLGADTSQSLAPAISQAAPGGGDEGFLHDLLDPSTGFMRDLTGGSQI